MSAKLAIFCAVVAFTVVGGAAAAFLLTGHSPVRTPVAKESDNVAKCEPQVRSACIATANVPPEQPRPATEPEATTVQPQPALLAGLEKALGALVAKQSETQEQTHELALDSGIIRVSKRRGGKSGAPMEIDAERLKVIVTAQDEIRQGAAKAHTAMKRGNMGEHAADMEPILALLGAISAILTAREPDIGDVTLAMQRGAADKLETLRASLEAARVAKVEVVEVPAVVEGAGKPLVVESGKSAKASGDRSVSDLRVEAGASLTLGDDTLTVSGDFSNAGTLESEYTSLVMNGGNQTFAGEAEFNRARFSGGTKRLVAGARLTTTYDQNSGKNNPVLVVEAGCTLVVEKDSVLHVPNAYGLRVEGTLIIDGGRVNVSYTHGHGVEGMNATWVKGSQLIIRSGSFIADGDSSFDGTSVFLQGGEIRCHDDIWGSGDLLEISGGVMSNNAGGAQFGFTGIVRMTGGRLEVNQYEGRGFVVGANCDFWCSGGEVVLGGQDVSGARSGIVLQRSVQLPTLKLSVSTRVSTNTPEGVVLSAAGVNIAKGKKFSAQGYQVIGNIETGEGFGTFEP